MFWNKWLLGLLFLCQLPGLGMGKARADSASELSKEFACTMDESLPKSAVARLGTLRFRHPGTVRSLAVSPDASLIASAGGSSENNNALAVFLWDRQTGKNIGRLVGHSRAPHALAFSPDGNLLASVAEVVSIREPKNRSESPEMWADFEVRLWSIKTGKVKSCVFGPTDISSSLHIAFSPNGKTFAFGSDSRVWLLDGKSGKQLQSWKGHGPLDFSPDGESIAFFNGQALVVRQISGRQEDQKSRFPFDSSVNGLVFVSKKRLFFESQGRVQWWEILGAKTAKTITGRLVALSNDKKYGAVFTQEKIIFLDLASTEELGGLPRGELADLVFNPSSFGALLLEKGFLAMSRGSAIIVLGIRTGKKLHSFAGHQGAVQLVAFSEAHHLISVGQKTIRLWDFERGRELKNSCPCQAMHIYAATFAPNGRTLVLNLAREMPALGTAKHETLVWDVTSFKMVRKHKHGDIKGRQPISQDSKLVALVCYSENSGEQVTIFDLLNGKEKASAPWFGGNVLGFLPGKNNLVMLDGAKVLFMSPKIKRSRAFTIEARLSRDYVEPAPGEALSPDCRMIAVASLPLGSPKPTRATGIWELSSGRKILSLPPEGGSGRCVSFLGPTRLAVGGWDGAVNLWDLSTGGHLVRFNGHWGPISFLDFSANGKWLATGSDDSSVLIWKLPNLSEKRIPSTLSLSQRQKEDLWDLLFLEDPSKAYQAIWQFVEAGNQTTTFLQRCLPKIVPNQRNVDRLLRNLNDSRFAVREKATRELQGFGLAIRPMLEAGVKGSLPLEVERRVRQILASKKVIPPELEKRISELEANIKINPLDLERLRQNLFKRTIEKSNLAPPAGSLPLQQVRAIRAIQILEYIGSPAALEIIRKTAQSEEPSWLKDEAQLVLSRLFLGKGPVRKPETLPRRQP